MPLEAEHSPERFATTLARIELRSATHADPTGRYVALRLSPSSHCQLYAARRLADDLPVLLIEVNTQAIPHDQKFPHSAGFVVDPEVILPGREGRVRLVLSPSDLRYEEVFMSLADDVSLALRDATSDRAGVATLAGRLAVWQEFFRRNPSAIMGLEARRGLYGELWFLYTHLGAVLSSHEAIVAWTGPLGRHHDFQFRNTGVEVKATTAVAPAKIRISNLRQLDPAGLRALYVHVIVVDEMQSGGQTLSSLVAAIREWAKGGGLAELDDALILVGYVGDAIQQSDIPAFHVRDERSFEVREGFPRLVEGQVPAGISGVAYDVDLHACRDYGVEIDGYLRTLGKPEP